VLEDLTGDDGFSRYDRALAAFWADAMVDQLAKRLRRDRSLILRFAQRDAAARLFPDHPAPQRFIRAYIQAVGYRLAQRFPDLRTRIDRTARDDTEGIGSVLIFSIGFPDCENVE
jgi:hypothetical protein